MLGTTQDITERKKNEEELVLAQKKFQAIFDNTAEDLSKYNGWKVHYGQFCYGKNPWLQIRGRAFTFCYGYWHPGLCKFGGPAKNV